jgi:hypothetical protein
LAIAFHPSLPGNTCPSPAVEGGPQIFLSTGPV